MEHARAVIIGGGVGGTSIAYHLAERGWTDIVLVERAELTSGSTFHSAGLVGQLRGLGDPDQDDDVRLRPVPPAARPRPASTRRGTRSARSGSRRRRSGWRSSSGRPAGRRPSGCRWTSSRASEAQDRFPLMSTEGVLGARLAADRRLARPVRPRPGAGGRCAAARRHDPDRRRGSSASASSAGASPASPSSTSGERSEIGADVVVNAGGMFAPEIGRMAGVTVPIIPMAHQYLFTEPIEGVHPGLPQLRDPDNLVYFREEVGGLCMGGYERDPAPWSLDGIPPDFNGKLLAPDLPRFEPIMDGAIRRVPAMADARVSRIINGPEAFTPDNEFILGEIGGARVLARRRVLRARDRRGGRHRSPGGELDRRRRARAGPVEDGHPPVRGGLSVAARTRSPARSRTTRPTTTSTTRTRSARPAGRCAPRRRTTTWPRSARSSARSPAGSARTGSSPTPTTRASAAATRSSGSGRAGWAGQHWSPAIAAEALATRQAAALFDETSFAKLEVVGPGACSFLQRMCAATTSTVRSARSSTRSCSIGAAASRPT